MPGPIIVLSAQQAQGAGRSLHAGDHASESVRLAQVKLRKMERWRRNPRHRAERWAPLLPEEEHSEPSESLTPVLEPTGHSDLTTGQTGQTSRPPLAAPKSDPAPLGLVPEDKPPVVKPDGPDEEPEAATGCAYLCTQEGRDHITIFFEDPTSSEAAYWVSIVVLITIVVSVIAMCVETLPQLEHYPCCKDTAYTVFGVVEVICIAMVTIVVGIMVMALPISVIGTNFSQAWDERKEEERREAPPLTAEEEQESICQSLRTVNSSLQVFNDVCHREITNCSAVYDEQLLPLLNRIWKSFKRRASVLATDPDEFHNEKLVQRHFLKLLRQRLVYKEGTDAIGGVSELACGSLSFILSGVQ